MGLKIFYSTLILNYILYTYYSNCKNVLRPQSYKNNLFKLPTKIVNLLTSEFIPIK